MLVDEPTILGADESIATPLIGGKPGAARDTEVTLSDEATLVWMPQAPSDKARFALSAGAARTRSRAPKQRSLIPARGGAWLAYLPRSVGASWLLGSALGLGLAVMLVLVTRWFHRADPAAVASELEVVAWVRTPSGRPVEGAALSFGGVTGSTDAQGRVRVTHRALGLGPEGKSFELTLRCPEGYVPVEAARTLRFNPVEASPTMSREVSWHCDVSTVPLSLQVQVRGGDVAVWLGDRALGETSQGLLRTSLEVPARSEQVLRFTPLGSAPSGKIPGKVSAPLPKVEPATRVLKIGEEPMSAQLLVQLSTPRARRVTSAKQIPYRL